MDTARGAVLVVDDDAELLKLLSLILGDAGYQVSVAGSLPLALAALRRSRYHLVLADTMGPIVTWESGPHWEPLEVLRAAAGATPVAILTAYPAEAFAEYGERGFADLLPKPFELEDLMAVVERHIAAV
jgi:two-component system response regulator GlrR